MPPMKLYIADADAMHVQRVADCVRTRRDIEIVGHTGDGGEALRALLERAVDLLITDVQLPGLDGIMLLKDLQRMNRCPPAIVCTRFYSGMCVESARRFGASYVLYKPLDYNRLPEIIEVCGRAGRRVQHKTQAAEPSERERAAAIRNLLLRMGVPTKLAGSLYLTDALAGYGGDRSLVRNLSKGLYVQIADRMQTTPSRVERALRTAIAVGYERGSMNKTFERRPSNRQFIEYLISAIEEGQA